MAEQRFAEPIVTADAIAASLSSLAQSLSGVLEQRGLGLRTLEASFFRADGVVRRIECGWARRCATPPCCCGCWTKSWMRWPIRWMPVSAST